MKRLDAKTIYMIIAGGFATFFTLIFTINLIYQADVVGLNPLQLVLVGTLLETVCFFCQVPTGVLADVFSRRLSVIFGLTLIGLGFVIEGSIPRFEAVLLCQVVWGVGITFVSGAEDAWLADEVGAENAGPIFLRASQVDSVFSLLAIIPSVILGSIALNLPVLFGGLMFIVLAIFLAVFMPENGFKRTHSEDRTTWQQMGQTMRSGYQLIRQNPTLLTILGVGVFYGLYSEGFDRLWRDHLQKNFTFPTVGNFSPVVWFGIISAVLTILSLIMSEFVRRRLDTNDHRAVSWTLFGCNAVMVLGFFVFALTGHFIIAVLAYWAISIMRHTTHPVYTAWINQHTDSSVRATVFSVSGQIDAFGQIIGGPIFGLIATIFSLRLEMFSVGVVLAPVLIILLRTSRRKTVPIASDTNPS